MQPQSFIRDTFLRCRYVAALLVVSLLLFYGAVQAAPSVDGLTIVLPDDGWYQVQDRNTYAEICAGVRSCTVPAGTYIVINHSTGERFEQVTVSANSGSGLTVGLTSISWPDDGWYQVQRADTYKSLCEGGRSCSLDSGTYIVINHTTGERWEGVEVAGGDSSNTSVVDLRYERYSASAIELFWKHSPVADLPTRYSVLQDGVEVGRTEGTSFFSEGVLDNREYQYLVRQVGASEGVTVTVPQVSDNGDHTQGTALSIATAEQVLRGVFTVLNEDAIDAFYATAQDDLAFQDKRFFTSNTIDDIVFAGGGVVDPPYQFEEFYGTGEFVAANRYAEYTCASGGGLRKYFPLSGTGSDVVFEDCVAGSNTYSGTTGIRNLFRGTISRFPAYNLTIQDSSGETRSLSGGYSSGNLSFVVTDSESSWQSANYMGPIDGGELRIQNYTVSRKQMDGNTTIGAMSKSLPDGTRVQVVQYQVANSVAGSFQVSAPWSENQTLQVSVTLSFEDDAVVYLDIETGEPVDGPGADPEEPFYWQEGSLTMEAEDGSRLQITPIDRDSFTISDGNGETLGPLRWDSGYEVKP